MREMNSVSIIRRLALAGLLLGAVLAWSGAAAAQVDQEELAEVRAAIEEEGLGWTAGETSAAALSPEERRARLFQPVTPEEIYQRLGGDPAPHPDFNKIPEHVPQPAPDDPVFNWRDVDGEDWTSPIANQVVPTRPTISVTTNADTPHTSARLRLVNLRSW